MRSRFETTFKDTGQLSLLPGVEVEEGNDSNTDNKLKVTDDEVLELLDDGISELTGDDSETGGDLEEDIIIEAESTTDNSKEDNEVMLYFSDDSDDDDSEYDEVETGSTGTWRLASGDDKDDNDIQSEDDENQQNKY